LEIQSTLILWAGSIIMTGLAITLIVLTVKRWITTKKDDGFWVGAGSVLGVYILVSSSLIGWDLLSKHHHTSSFENATYRVEMSEKGIRDHAGIENLGCVVEETLHSEQCIFLMLIEEGERVLMVGNEEYSLVRRGEWPNEKIVRFGPFKING